MPDEQPEKPKTSECWMCGLTVPVPFYGSIMTCPACDVKWVVSARSAEQWEALVALGRITSERNMAERFGFDQWVDHAVTHAPSPA